MINSHILVLVCNRMLLRKLAINLKCCTMLMIINLLGARSSWMCSIISFFCRFEQFGGLFIEFSVRKKQEKTAGASLPIIYVYSKTE